MARQLEPGQAGPMRPTHSRIMVAGSKTFTIDTSPDWTEIASRIGCKDGGTYLNDPYDLVNSWGKNVIGMGTSTSLAGTFKLNSGVWLAETRLFVTNSSANAESLTCALNAMRYLGSGSWTQTSDLYVTFEAMSIPANSTRLYLQSHVFEVPSPKGVMFQGYQTTDTGGLADLAITVDTEALILTKIGNYGEAGNISLL